jgi:hypothetical protein
MPATAQEDKVRVPPPEARCEPADEIVCDACGSPMPRGDDDEGYAVPGEGMYLWTRGDEVRFEKVPLCASCASAIGLAAWARWEIEEEEG